MLSFEPLHASIDKMVFEILETPLGHAVSRCKAVFSAYLAEFKFSTKVIVR